MFEKRQRQKCKFNLGGLSYKISNILFLDGVLGKKKFKNLDGATMTFQIQN